MARKARSTTREVRTILLHMTEKFTTFSKTKAKQKAEGFLLEVVNVEVALCFLRLLLFLSRLSSCCLSLVLKSPAFMAVLEMSHFPSCNGLRKMGLSTLEREFTHTGSCFNESTGRHVRLSFGKKLWLKNLSLTCCEMNHHKHFLCQALQLCWSIAHAQFTHGNEPANINSLTVNEWIIIFTSWCGVA